MYKKHNRSQLWRWSHGIFYIKEWSLVSVFFSFCAPLNAKHIWWSHKTMCWWGHRLRNYLKREPVSHTHFHVLKVSSTNCHVDTSLLLRLGGIKAKYPRTQSTQPANCAGHPHKLQTWGNVSFLNVNTDYQHRVAEIEDIWGKLYTGFIIIIFQIYPNTKFYEEWTDEFLYTYKKTPINATYWVVVIHLDKLRFYYRHCFGVTSDCLSFFSFTFKHIARYMTLET